MTSIYAKKFNWLPTPTAFQQAQAWRQKRRAMMNDFQTKMSAFTETYSKAIADQIDGSAELVVKTAIDRLNTAAKAKKTKSIASLLDRSA
jgi:hypothetical protein